MWTCFYDIGTAGYLKEPPYTEIYIEDNIDNAIKIFYSKFSHSPNRVTSTQAGSDYFIYSNESLDDLTSYFRNCKYDINSNKYLPDEHSISIKEYSEKPNVLFIHKSQISNDDKNVEVPTQGYVWV